jgi:hypothetical protein
MAFSPDDRLIATQQDGEDAVLVREVSSGQVRARLHGHQEAVRCLAFSPDGSVLASGSDDGTVLIWDMRGGRPGTSAATRLGHRDLGALWADLASPDGIRAGDAVARLAEAPDAALPLLRCRLSPVPVPGRDRLARLIADLDDWRFTVRDRAAETLAALQEAAGPALRQALREPLSPEARRTVTGLLDRLRGPGLPPDVLRQVRAVEVLERIGKDACPLLEALAAGAPPARLSREAKTALQRLTVSSRREEPGGDPRCGPAAGKAVTFGAHRPTVGPPLRGSAGCRCDLAGTAAKSLRYNILTPANCPGKRPGNPPGRPGR